MHCCAALHLILSPHSVHEHIALHYDMRRAKLLDSMVVSSSVTDGSKQRQNEDHEMSYHHSCL